MRPLFLKWKFKFSRLLPCQLQLFVPFKYIADKFTLDPKLLRRLINFCCLCILYVHNLNASEKISFIMGASVGTCVCGCLRFYVLAFATVWHKVVFNLGFFDIRIFKTLITKNALYSVKNKNCNNISTGTLYYTFPFP